MLVRVKKDNRIGISTVVVEEPAHGAIVMLSSEDISNLHYGTIQSEIIIACFVLPCCETNTAPIRSAVLHRVACEFVAHKGLQTEVKANTQIISVENQAVATTERMNYTAAPVTIGQKTDKNYPFHDKSGHSSML